MDGVRRVDSWLKRIYNWVLHWAETPYGGWALLMIAFCESSFFPVPPDLLLIVLSISIPKKSFLYAFISSCGSILGGIFGYLIGLEFMDLIGFPIIRFYGVVDQYQSIQKLYQQYDAWAVGIAGFTPIPYKVATISAGAFKINFLVFLIASAISRSMRFFSVGALIYFVGPSVRFFIERYFNILAIAFVVLLLVGFLAIRWIL
jgi:membrane protein YqaA with SNARE-associated domain